MHGDDPDASTVIFWTVLLLALLGGLASYMWFVVLGHRGHLFSRAGYLRLQRELHDSRQREREEQHRAMFYNLYPNDTRNLVEEMEDELKRQAHSARDHLDVAADFHPAVRLARLELLIAQMEESARAPSSSSSSLTRSSLHA